jgi:hypothetical protein
MHYERGAGVAESFGISFLESERDPFLLWFNMAAPGCSTVFYPGAFTASGHATLSRNYDFSTGTFAEMLGGEAPKGARPMDADAYVMEVHPDEGYASLYVCAYDLLSGALDGINSAGLTVALLADEESVGETYRASSVQAGLNQLEVPRLLLETCADVDEAKAALLQQRQYCLFLPAHFIVGDRSGRSFVWEYGDAHDRTHVTEGGGKPQVVTNHALYRYKSTDEFPKPCAPGSSYGRYLRMQSAIGDLKDKCTLDEMKRINDGVRATGSEGSRAPNRTLWHALYDCEDRTLDVDFYLGEAPSPGGGERRSGYLKFRLER